MPEINRSSDAAISQRTTVWAAQEMLEYAGAVQVLDKFGDVKPLPPNKGLVVKFRRPRTFTAVTAPLVEGVTPGSTAFGYDDVSVTLRQYGQVVEITDVIKDTHEDAVLQDATQQAGDNIGRTTEALTWGILRAGTNVYYTNGTARNAVNTPVSTNVLRGAVRFLKAQKGKPITRMLAPSNNYATRAVEGGYIAIGHTDLENDIRNLPGFLPVAEYGSRQPIHEMELGTVENIRFILSPDLDSIADAGGALAGASGDTVSTSGTSADIYPLLVIASKAYGMVPLKGKGSVTPFIYPPGKPTPTDPLGQRGFVSWKIYFGALILNQAWMVRIECAALDIV